jgi:hypothetical protein
VWERLKIHSTDYGSLTIAQEAFCERLDGLSRAERYTVENGLQDAPS